LMVEKSKSLKEVSIQAHSRQEEFGDLSNGTHHRLAKEKVSKAEYEERMHLLHIELLKLQYWIKAQGVKLVALFEGRDAAGKGGVIKRIIEHINPRGCRVVALEKPTEREMSQWYFQRYVAHLPSAGEMVLFDRSWYNRAGVERVMGYCSEDQVDEFLQAAPEFEKMLKNSSIHLIKFWFSISKEEQARRFTKRETDPLKQWKLSPIDRQCQPLWQAYSQAKEEMFIHTSTDDCPWVVIKANDKRQARQNAISYLLSQFDYDGKNDEALVLDRRIIRSVRDA